MSRVYSKTGFSPVTAAFEKDRAPPGRNAAAEKNGEAKPPRPFQTTDSLSRNAEKYFILLPCCPERFLYDEGGVILAQKDLFTLRLLCICNLLP